MPHEISLGGGTKFLAYSGTRVDAITDKKIIRIVLKNALDCYLAFDIVDIFDQSINKYGEDLPQLAENLSFENGEDFLERMNRYLENPND